MAFEVGNACFKKTWTNYSTVSLLYTEVRFDSFLSGGFTTIEVINPPERKLAKKRTSVLWFVQVFLKQTLLHMLQFYHAF